MLPKRDAAATTGNARADGSKRPLVVGAGAGAASFHQKYHPAPMAAARTMTANAHARRRRPGKLAKAALAKEERFGSGEEGGLAVIGSFARNTPAIVPDYR